MNKWLAVVVLGLSIVAGSIGWRKAVQHFNHSSANAPTLIAQGGDPVPPSPWKFAQGGDPVPPSPW